MVLKDNKEKINQLPLPWLKKMSPEEHSNLKRTKMLQWDKKLLKSKDLSLMPDLEERELINKIKLEDGKELLNKELNILN